MARMTPAQNDTEWDLTWKIANNWYDIAIDAGITGLTPPNMNLTQWELLSLTAYYTAKLD